MLLKLANQEDHYDEVTDREVEEELKKEELFKEAKKQEDASDSISVFNQEFKRKRVILIMYRLLVMI